MIREVEDQPQSVPPHFNVACSIREFRWGHKVIHGSYAIRKNHWPPFRSRVHTDLAQYSTPKRLHDMLILIIFYGSQSEENFESKESKSSQNMEDPSPIPSSPSTLVPAHTLSVLDLSFMSQEHIQNWYQPLNYRLGHG
ncbi:hypothetical protein VNO77_34817 [Canavalia gladiata]|uniref:Uncharacterized protein n=1 Tax=Canavalia gladiata TaxID=3824 RepID=A0AAN9Q209_CANGL